MSATTAAQTATLTPPARFTNYNIAILIFPYMLLQPFPQGGMTCYNDLSFIEHLVSNILLKELNIDPTRYQHHHPWL